MKNPRKYGNAPYSLVVVHGGPGAGGEMAPVARELAFDRGVLEPIQTATTIRGQIEELKTVLQTSGELPVTLIGFSWGAWLCFLLSANHPALIKKLILIGSGPFEEKYAAEIQQTRLNRLNERERTEVKSLLETLNNKTAKDKSSSLSRIGMLFSNADAFDPIKHHSDNSEINFQLEIFQSVWKEAAELRRSGVLLKLGKQIKCPVTAFHGDYDPHPAKGVQKPLSTILQDFRFILLKNCGHKAWVEKYAKDKFYALLKKELH